MSALFRHLDAVGLDTNLIWSKIYDILIKSIIAIEPVVTEAVRRIAINRSNCFELFGFDIMIDSNLKPWLLEVNLSPSLAADSPLDLFIKSNLIADMFNLTGVRIYDRKKDYIHKARTRLRAKQNQLNYVSRPDDKDNHTHVAVLAHSARFKEILREMLEEE